MKITISDVALFYQIDEETAKICLLNALGSYFQKEIIFFDGSYCFRNRHDGLSKIRITGQTLNKIGSYFAKEVQIIRNNQLKKMYYHSKSLAQCKVIGYTDNYYILVMDSIGVKGRLHFSNILPNFKVKIGDTIFLKIKSLIKVKGENLFIATQLDYGLYTPLIYGYINQLDISKIKIDFKSLKIIVGFIDKNYKENSRIKHGLQLLPQLLSSFKILTKYQPL